MESEGRPVHDGWVDSQSAKRRRDRIQATRGFDAGKKVNGCKRLIAVDAPGLPVISTLTPANSSDREAAHKLFWRLRFMGPSTRRSGPTPPMPASSPTGATTSCA
ncbi:transposase [Streptomyces sp. NPDC091219]|uniref:transposase n=1 Tax=Streptomyces sp. NPDC091219 TaxID=3155193 RepID=UPI00344D207D